MTLQSDCRTTPFRSPRWPPAQITYDAAYDTVERDDFPAMMATARYGRRSDAFEPHHLADPRPFLGPAGPDLYRFQPALRHDDPPILPLDNILELRSAVADRLDDRQKIQLANDVTHWSLSKPAAWRAGRAVAVGQPVPHPARPGAQEYAANQAREEARHVAGFTRYIGVRWGEPLPVGPTVGKLLTELVTTTEVYRKIVGMQMLVEGPGDGRLRHAQCPDPRPRCCAAWCSW